ncbi:hypothetical protein GGS21DRAFT_510316 [Xylaria nigripes]|nr:hypothetical protein GGS21DRAFT_510316 [Xylaria nigripes]
MRTPIDVSGLLYSSIKEWVSHKALQKIDVQRQQLALPRSEPQSSTRREPSGFELTSTSTEIGPSSIKTSFFRPRTTPFIKPLSRWPSQSLSSSLPSLLSRSLSKSLSKLLTRSLPK